MTTSPPPYADTGAAQLYARSRPQYPLALVDTLAAHVGVRAGDAVTDVGAGTGLFTRTLADRGLHVTGLEPCDAMRELAPALPGVTWRSGTFERTGLADASQAWVVSAQAFHWADARAALPEIRRVLRPGGWFTALWNAQELAHDPVLEWTYAALRRHVPQYGYVDRAKPLRRRSSRALGWLPGAAQCALGRLATLAGDPGRLSRGLMLVSSGGFSRLAYHELSHRVPVSLAGYLDIWRSRMRLRSMADPGRFETFLAELEDHLIANGIQLVDVSYVCAAWSAQAAR